MKQLVVSIALASVLAIGARAQSQTCDPVNVLWFGNSLSYASPLWFELMVAQAGLPAANLDAQIAGGSRLRDWVADLPTLQGLIANSAVLPPGETWDYVVIQAYSTEPTTVRGNPASYAADVLTMVQEVHAHSPNAIAVLVQTHAYNAAHSYYPTFYTDPAQMNADVRAGVDLAASQLAAQVGPELVRVSRPGDVFQAAGFPASLYRADFLHPDEPGRMLIGSTLFEAIYRHKLSEITVNAVPANGPYTTLEQRLLTYGIPEPLYSSYRSYIDAASHPMPGSNEDLFLSAGIDAGPWFDDPSFTIAPGQNLTLRYTSPGQAYASSPLHLFVMHMYLTGTAVPSLGIPEVHLPPGPSTIVDVIGAPVVGGSTYSLFLPLGIQTGVSFRMQVATFSPSGCRGNLFTATDGMDGRIQ